MVVSSRQATSSGRFVDSKAALHQVASGTSSISRFAQPRERLDRTN